VIRGAVTGGEEQVKKTFSKLPAALGMIGVLLAGLCLAMLVRATDSAAAGPFPPGALIRYVVLGDSIQGEAPAWYAQHLQRDLGVRVAFDDWKQGSSSSGWLAKQLRTNEPMRAALRTADVITLNVPLGMAGRCDPVLRPRFRSAAKFRRCIAGTVAPYKRHVKAIFRDLVALRPPSQALIRITDTWQFEYRGLHKLGLYAIQKRYWKRYNAIVHKTAARYQIPVARAYVAMNGAAGRKDPIAAGYVQQDQIHLNPKGAVLLAKLYRNLGYRLAPAAP
jgi:lysophospholipase L1-like esterase